MSQKQTKLIKEINPTKNGNKAFLTIIFADGSMQAVRAKFVEGVRAKGGSLEMAELTLRKKGDYIFGVDETGKPIPAPQDSSTKDAQGNLRYVAGDTPQYEQDQWVVTGFTSKAVYLANLEILAMEKKLAAM